MELIQDAKARVRALELILQARDGVRVSIGSLVAGNAKATPDAPALVDNVQELTWQMFNQQANRVAHALKSQGVGPGDTVALSMQNRIGYLVAAVGIVKLGAYAALINTAQRGHVLQSSFAVVKPKLLLIGSEQLATLSSLDEKPSMPIWAIADPENPAERPAGVQDFDALMATSATSNPSETDRVVVESPAFYVFTSGTTGLPKAAIMSHKRWIKASSGFGMAALKFRPTDRMYVCLPFYHNNAISISLGTVVASGASMAIRRKFSASNFWSDIRRFQANSFTYIGELCRYLMMQPARPDDADNPVTKIAGNGLRPDIWLDFKKRFGIERVIEFYAASESNTGFANFFNKDQTVGVSPSPWELVQYDHDNEDIVRNRWGRAVKIKGMEPGLLVTKITKRWSLDGYTNKEATNKKILRNLFRRGDAWFDTGDLMRRTDTGFWPPVSHLQFVDRLGDTFRWKGENVSTTEVEESLNAIDQIQECTVYGVQVPGADGRAGMAAVVLAQDQPDWQGIAQDVSRSLPEYARPLFIRVVDSLVTTGTFKHRKVELKKLGLEPGDAVDPLFWLQNGCYVPFDAAAREQIQAGTARV